MYFVLNILCYVYNVVTFMALLNCQAIQSDDNKLPGRLVAVGAPFEF